MACRLAGSWREAIEMPADVAILLLDEMTPGTEKPKRQDKVETMPDGTRKVSFASIEGLAHALKDAGFSGVKIGADPKPDQPAGAN